jgi:hypothetical protein
MKVSFLSGNQFFINLSHCVDSGLLVTLWQVNFATPKNIRYGKDVSVGCKKTSFEELFQGSKCSQNWNTS